MSTVQLKVGSWYRTRNGKPVYIERIESGYTGIFIGGNGYRYLFDGSLPDAFTGTPVDLVSEIRNSDDVPMFEEPVVEATLTPWISEIVYTNEHTSTNLELPMTDDQIRGVVEDILSTRSGVQTVRVYKLAHTVSRKTTLSWE